MTNEEIKNLSTPELQERLQAESAKLADMKISQNISPVEDNSQFGKIRKNIARISTELTMRSKSAK